ncbi:MAG: hypothetical protein M3Q08_07815 [Pseudomonadota bacterium]|nr:hypothetical protein [Pseudomonadota bacterium]
MTGLTRTELETASADTLAQGSRSAHAAEPIAASTYYPLLAGQKRPNSREE